MKGAGAGINYIFSLTRGVKGLITIDNKGVEGAKIVRNVEHILCVRLLNKQDELRLFVTSC